MSSFFTLNTITFELNTMLFWTLHHALKHGMLFISILTLKVGKCVSKSVECFSACLAHNGLGMQLLSICQRTYPENKNRLESTQLNVPNPILAQTFHISLFGNNTSLYLTRPFVTAELILFPQKPLKMPSQTSRLQRSELQSTSLHLDFLLGVCSSLLHYDSGKEVGYSDLSRNVFCII